MYYFTAFVLTLCLYLYGSWICCCPNNSCTTFHDPQKRCFYHHVRPYPIPNALLVTQDILSLQKEGNFDIVIRYQSPYFSKFMSCSKEIWEHVLQAQRCKRNYPPLSAQVNSIISNTGRIRFFTQCPAKRFS